MTRSRSTRRAQRISPPPPPGTVRHWCRSLPTMCSTARRRPHPAGTRIIRTAWLYGQHGGNFAATMLRLAGERDTIDVVSDQLGQPTWTMDLAARIVAMLDAGAPSGIYHGTNSGQATWFDFARAVFELGGFDPDRVKPTDSAQFQRPAPRPSYSVLSHDAWRAVGLEPMRDWRSALRSAFASGALASLSSGGDCRPGSW